MRVIEDLLLLRQLKRTFVGQVGKVDPQVERVAGRWLCGAGGQDGDSRNDRRNPKG